MRSYSKWHISNGIIIPSTLAPLYLLLSSALCLCMRIFFSFSTFLRCLLTSLDVGTVNLWIRLNIVVINSSVREYSRSKSKKYVNYFVLFHFNFIFSFSFIISFTVFQDVSISLNVMVYPSFFGTNNSHLPGNSVNLISNQQQ